jgi:hypothetical protein
MIFDHERLRVQLLARWNACQRLPPTERVVKFFDSVERDPTICLRGFDE